MFLLEVVIDEKIDEQTDILPVKVADHQDRISHLELKLDVVS